MIGPAAIGAEQAAEIRRRIDEADVRLPGHCRLHEVGPREALQCNDVHAGRDDEIGQQRHGAGRGGAGHRQGRRRLLPPSVAGASPSCAACCASNGADEAAFRPARSSALWRACDGTKLGGHLVSGDGVLGDQPVEDRDERFLALQRGLVVRRRHQQMLRLDRRADQPPDFVLLAHQRRRQGLQATDIVVGVIAAKPKPSVARQQTISDPPSDAIAPAPTRTPRAGRRGATCRRHAAAARDDRAGETTA